jgi:hypothetical protein
MPMPNAPSSDDPETPPRQPELPPPSAEPGPPPADPSDAAAVFSDIAGGETDEHADQEESALDDDEDELEPPPELVLLRHKFPSLRRHGPRAARTSQEGLAEGEGQATPNGGDRVGHVALWPDRGIRGVDNLREGQALGLPRCEAQLRGEKSP